MLKASEVSCNAKSKKIFVLTDIRQRTFVFLIVDAEIRPVKFFRAQKKCKNMQKSP